MSFGGHKTIYNTCVKKIFDNENVSHINYKPVAIGYVCGHKKLIHYEKKKNSGSSYFIPRAGLCFTVWIYTIFLLLPIVPCANGAIA